MPAIARKLTLLPESNLVPLAQLRADRFLYLPLFAVAVTLQAMPPVFGIASTA